MRRLAGTVLVIALASASCIGSSSAGSSQRRGVSPAVPPPPKTDLMITYTAAQCPPGARCVLVTSGRKVYTVRRHLTCSPDGGDYDDPEAVCRALVDLVTKRDADPTASYICACPALPLPLAKAVGIYHGKRRTIPLDGCSLCNLRGIGADLRLLMPQA